MIRTPAELTKLVISVEVCSMYGIALRGNFFGNRLFIKAGQLHTSQWNELFLTLSFKIWTLYKKSDRNLLCRAFTYIHKRNMLTHMHHWKIMTRRMRTPVREAFSYEKRHGIRHIHCDSMKYDLMLHWITMNMLYAVPYPVWKCLPYGSTHPPYWHHCQLEIEQIVIKPQSQKQARIWCYHAINKYHILSGPKTEIISVFWPDKMW